jgi:malate dehydrogenase (oxaloacetate-decarboxylating)
MADDIYARSLKAHAEKKGKIAIQNKMPLETKDDLSIAYTPGVAEPCKVIAKNKDDAYKYTIKSNTVCVLSDGSAVLGLGNLGAAGAIPVMEGKCALFKRFGNLDAWPICVQSQKPEDIIMVAKNIAPVFGGINLEDIAAPGCFQVEQALQDIGIPVMHDDQHGTAIVVLAALINAAKVVKKQFHELTIAMNGSGAAGIAIANILLQEDPATGRKAVKDIILCDTKGIIYDGRKENMNSYKEEIAKRTNKRKLKGNLADAMKGADTFIGVSGPNQATAEMVGTMAPGAIILALSNPTPEIMPDEARKGGAAVVASGRSDFPNQVNNVLAFPAVFRGAIDARAPRITLQMKLAAAQALADCVKSPTADKIIPSPFDSGVHDAVAKAVMTAATSSNR